MMVAAQQRVPELLDLVGNIHALLFSVGRQEVDEEVRGGRRAAGDVSLEVP